jgi:hypothetical protein
MATLQRHTKAELIGLVEMNTRTLESQAHRLQQQQEATRTALLVAGAIGLVWLVF